MSIINQMTKDNTGSFWFADTTLLKFVPPYPVLLLVNPLNPNNNINVPKKLKDGITVYVYCVGQRINAINNDVFQNILLLKNLPEFEFMIKKEKEYADLIIATNGSSAPAKQNYEDFYNVCFEVLYKVLETMHDLYWYNKPNGSKIRSSISIDELENDAIELGLKYLKVKKIISDITHTSNLLGNQVKRDFFNKKNEKNIEANISADNKSVKSRKSKK